ncbi:SpoIIAA family protein [Rhizorhapis sp. SPR117]|uniref:STAS/SEC14 domain-containing protein n=1 Tax=Rhizorhapis sp. SPR117 TaxID=2912611 RepID=UPI001F2D2D70|nr:STAS/SEC14 domain-containing protein [Rhizorhapis sp. SPR117]
MLTHRLDPETGIIEIDIDGAADMESYRALVRDLDAEIAAHGKILILEIIRDIGWISPGIWWEDMGWSFHHLKDIARVAVVTDKGWIGPIAKMMGAVMAAEIRVFDFADIGKAREWLAG